MDWKLWNWQNLLLVFLVFVAGMFIWHYLLTSMTGTNQNG